ncbi:MAG: hypothetical protein AAGE52_13000 [Myxococcota bacterium]
MDEDQVLFALQTPVRRFPGKAIEVAAADPSIGIAVARRVLQGQLESIRAGAQARPIEGTAYFDPADHFGAVHATFLVAFHRAQEAMEELNAIVHLSDRQMDALYGDTTHVTLPDAIDFVPDDETILRWCEERLAPDAEAVVHDAVLRRVGRGTFAREDALALFHRALRRWVDDTSKDAASGRQLTSLAYAGICRPDEVEPLRRLLESDGVDPDGTLTAEVVDAIGQSEPDLSVPRDEPIHPREVERMGIYAWQAIPKVAKKKKPQRKKPKRKKKRK